MSRSGYADDLDDPLALGRWRQAVRRSLNGKRGQAFLKELLAALDAMNDKRLFAGSFASPEGQFCTLGVLGSERGTQMEDLIVDDDYCDTDLVADRFGIANAMACEIMWMNDESFEDYEFIQVEICGPIRPRFPDYGRHIKSVNVKKENAEAKRWQAMRNWVASEIKQD